MIRVVHGPYDDLARLAVLVIAVILFSCVKLGLRLGFLLWVAEAAPGKVVETMDARKLIEAIEVMGHTARYYVERGRTRACVSVTLSKDDEQPFNFIASLTLALGDEDANDLVETKIRQASVGEDVVIYFPGVAWPQHLTDPQDEIDPDAQCEEHGCAKWRCVNAHVEEKKGGK